MGLDDSKLEILARYYFVFCLLSPVVLDMIDMIFDLFYLNEIFQERVLIEPDYVKLGLTAWMYLSIIKFLVLIFVLMRLTNTNDESMIIVFKFFEMFLVFIFEDSVMVYFQYFFHDKYSFSGLSQLNWSTLMIVANAIWRSGHYFWTLYSSDERR